MLVWVMKIAEAVQEAVFLFIGEGKGLYSWGIKGEVLTILLIL
jgi:hypothetical protein